MTEWPVCEGCGKRHPTRKDIYHCLVHDLFEDEPPEIISYKPTEMRVIVEGLHKTLEVYPVLADKTIELTDSVIKILTELGRLGELDLLAPNDEAVDFPITTAQYALIIFALEELIEIDSDLKEEATQILNKDI